MKKISLIKKAFTAGILLSCMMLPAFSSEWGGVFKNDSKFASVDFSSVNTKQSNSLYLWIKTPVKAPVNFSAEGMYKFNFDYADKTAAITHILDIDLFKLAGSYDAGAGNFSFALGRFAVTDNTGVSFAQNCDGLSLKLNYSQVQLAGYAGYTGLLNLHNVSMIDYEGSAMTAENQLYSVSFAQALIPAFVSVNFPSLFANQTLGLQAETLVSPVNPSANRYFGNIQLSGFVSNQIYYSFVTEFGSSDFKSVMNYSSLDVTYYITKKMVMNTGIKYASGNNGFLSPFRGLTSITAFSSSPAPEMSGVFVPYAGFIINAGPTSTQFAVKPACTCMEAFEFNGLDLNFDFTGNVFSDLQLGLNIHGFVDILTKGKDNLFSATLKAVVAF